MDDQLELAFAGLEHSGPGEPAVALPALSLNEETTPGHINFWWEELVAIFTEEAQKTKKALEPIEGELAGLKGPNTRERKAKRKRLSDEKAAALAKAEAVEFEAYALFEGTLSEFSPRVIAMLQSGGMKIPDDDEMAVACFWDCLQRPDIEYCANITLREIAAVFCREHAG